MVRQCTDTHFPLLFSYSYHFWRSRDECVYIVAVEVWSFIMVIQETPLGIRCMPANHDDRTTGRRSGRPLMSVGSDEEAAAQHGSGRNKEKLLQPAAVTKERAKLSV